MAYDFSKQSFSIEGFNYEIFTFITESEILAKLSVGLQISTKIKAFFFRLFDKI